MMIRISLHDSLKQHEAFPSVLGKRVRLFIKRVFLNSFHFNRNLGQAFQHSTPHFFGGRSAAEIRSPLFTLA